MTDDAHTIPDEIASRTARLINEAEDMRQQAADDLKQIYADLREELKGLGWNGASVSAEVAALKGAIAEMRLDEKSKTKREQRGERIDDYVSLLTRARARGGKPKDDISRRLAKQVVDGMQTEAGRAALIAAVDIMTEREEAAEEFQAKASGDNGATGQANEVAADSVTGDASRSSRGDDSPAPNSQSDDDAIAEVKGSARLANAAGVEPSSSAPIATATQGEAVAPSVERETDRDAAVERDRAAANTGGDHVTAQPSTAAQAGDPVSKPPAAYLLRPHCQHPGEERCGGYGSKHCATCLRAIRELEAAE
ncbi:hypothetical protein FHT86_002181 [Rhizobium sp. BK313]|uniref:hypothetical protein n=1 Tax=Rhizobium sp. BK313 TaxID=2587081 RepID=UPI001607B847|nr:hypothetical protein [Rhizobium sp. BK313]MBB3453925.1 hypothetical protein [Rhizobium sp. BK313]